ncbi:MAG: MotA/TolQ/ExbB proton channel family protein [Phycisphaeraceae bacterium]
MRRSFPTRSLFPASILLLATASPALAQEGGSSYFKMFFTSDDIIGQGIIILLVLLSAVSIGMTIKFALQFRRSNLVPEDSEEEMQTLLSEKKFREAIEYAKNDDSYLGQVTSAALNEASNGYVAMERAIEEAGDAQTTKLLRPLEYLNVLGQVSPMLGLFGTVYGMIVAFQRLVDAGGGADPQTLAAGISTALVTTLWGLIVAIPALAAYSVIRNRVDAFTSDGMLVAEELVSVFKPGRKSGKASAAGGGGASGGSGGDGPSGGSARPRATPKPE